MGITKHIPNLLTIANLLCGCLGILYAYEYPPVLSAYFVWIACVFDFFDGFTARALKAYSPLGGQLDSLADLVSFGVLPSMVMYTWIDAVAPNEWMAYSAFLIAAFSAIRLAKFNIDDNQKDAFIGLPTPANALFITGLVFLQPPFSFVTADAFVLVIITVAFSILLIAPLDLFALKFKNYTWSDNKLRFTFVGLSVLLVGFLLAAAVPLIILLYIILSLVGNKFAKG
ncbi:MAG: CDP-diacylglycerol--serine O-phosphatidyltransferase [Cyclobacteriaceae bacterium]